MQDYIEENICEVITLHELAECARFSPFHCARIFKELTGKSPFEYIRMMRLSRAALKLRDEKTRIIDVAFDFVFDSHEGFTRAFSREFGITPQNYRRQPRPVYLFMPTPVRDRYLFFLKEKNKMDNKQFGSTVFVQVIERPERKLILKRGRNAADYLEYCEEVGCEIWGLLCSIKEALYEPIGMWLPDAFRPSGTSIYAQGVEVPVNYSGIVPDDCDIITLPSCKMMVFQGPPFKDEEFDTAIGHISEIIKTYDPQIYGFQWADEDAPRFQLEPQGYRGYIEARPVR